MNHIKRYIYLIHRWTGILMCLLMALWLVSGIVMLFIGSPKLTPWERLAALAPLPASGCCIEPTQALAQSRAAAEVKGLTLTSIRGRPHYVIQEGNGSLAAVDALSGARAAVVDRQAALDAAHAFRPGASATYAGQVDQDRWTHSRRLNAHRPLHVVELDDAAATRVYVSSATGEVVLDAAASERNWNMVGAWLHWLNMLRGQPGDEVRTWTLILLSGLGVFSAASGMANGLWRWRFAGRYKNGSRSPYRESYMRWHHLLGLGFGLILFAWIFSGLMSLNPGGIFDAKGQGGGHGAAHGSRPTQLRLALSPGAALDLLKAENFYAKELEWRVLDGEAFILARNAANDTRLVVASHGGFSVLLRWPEERLLRAAATLRPYPIAALETLTQYDSYYYARNAASMYGNYERRLPVLRIVYGDADRTWVHLDVRTGLVEQSTVQSQRARRWLFNLLHSWDLPPLLASGWLREAVLVALSIGGLLLSVTAAVIGLRRIRHWAGVR
ncbi:PepSY domain-containing protein [Massilia sp. YIM B04103]|uniref:PepSY domain-containing protein n=1 Tax=Massilia sp. YIM B04103 TaxID=2963106 RepID=UPI00210A1457|nr:PepSY domain-containing protein [Massilia sp. YIM B04103]